MERVLGAEDAEDWVYRGEGAVNLVLAYSGYAPPFLGKVLRIQKASRSSVEHVDGPSMLTTHERLLWRDAKDPVSSPNREIAKQLYVEHVMGPLLGAKFIDAGEFLELVEKNVHYQRPAWRIDASKVNTLCDSMLNGEPCISVEIKPKCGFLPSSTFIPEANCIKCSATRFRMHQVLKLQRQEVSQISEYNPLDLFSGSMDRIQKAIKALFTTPQNNFWVFLNGSLIFGSLGGVSDGTSFVDQNSFEDAIKTLFHSEKGLRTTDFLKLVSEAMYKSKVLDRLLEVQKLDDYDIEGAIHAYYSIVSEPCVICKNLNEDTLSTRYDSLHSISLDGSLKIVRDYLIAATAKDCSLMINFRAREEGKEESACSNIHLDSTNQSFEYKVYFVNLDTKPLEKMVHYYKLDQSIVNFYSQKTILSVDLLCSKCRKKVMKLMATIEGINSIVLDPSKSTVTVIGEADPLKIIKKARKFRKSAEIVSIGPPKEEKKDEKDIIPSLPRMCQKCDVWYVVREDFSYCNIL
ncbi:Heavy metal-associated domain, HMA [Dillenia turbinata]|uniref:Inositol-pentakisphosphate 2-kinase n=1 Tax=Dillenia turbinata TaxID=194707 RepID=A0AAN8ZI71_9MAGN